jgi:hypothetical protein
VHNLCESDVTEPDSGAPRLPFEETVSAIRFPVSGFRFPDSGSREPDR